MKLLAAAETYPGSTAECERGFSQMNETVWDKRNPMNVSTVSSTMFVKLNGVSLTNFDLHIRMYGHGLLQETVSLHPG